MTNEVINEGLLIEFDPSSSSKFVIVANTVPSSGSYVPTQEFENLVSAALERIYNSGTEGRQLFESMLAAGQSNVKFAIGLSKSSSALAGGGRYDLTCPCRILPI